MSKKQANYLRTPLPPKGAGNAKPFSGNAAQKPNFSVPRERASNTSTARRTNYQISTRVLSTSSSDSSVPNYDVPVLNPPEMTPEQFRNYKAAMHGTNNVPLSSTKNVQSPYSTGSTIDGPTNVSPFSTGSSSMSIDEPPVVGGEQNDEEPPASSMLTNFVANLKPFAAPLASIANNPMFSEFIAFLTGRDHKPLRWTVVGNQLVDTPLGKYVFDPDTNEYYPLSNTYEKPWVKEKRVGYVVDNNGRDLEVVIESQSDLKQIPIKQLVLPVNTKSAPVRHTDLKNYAGKITFKDESKKSYLKRLRAHNAKQARGAYLQPQPQGGGGPYDLKRTLN